jgi:hypothetical protein
MSDIKQVADAIANVIDHGDDCGCSICAGDFQTIQNNPDIAAALSGIANALINKNNDEQ